MLDESCIHHLLQKRETYARVLYALAFLGLLSPDLALDFVGICKLCDLDRHRRTKLKRLILNPAERVEIFAKEKRCPLDLGAGSNEVSPPLVEKEYTRDEIKQIRKMRKKPEPYELAVLFMKDTVTGKRMWRAVISEEYRQYAAGRAGARNGFRIVEDKIIPIVQFLTAVAYPFSTRSIDEWVRPQIRQIHQNLEQLLVFYLASKTVRRRLQQLTEPDKMDAEVLLFIGFGLTDFRRIQFTQSLEGTPEKEFVLK